MLLVTEWEKYTELHSILTLWTRESKFHPFFALIFGHDSELPGMNWLSHIFFTAEKFIKNCSHYWNSRSGSLSLRQLMGTNFAMTLQGHASWNEQYYNFRRIKIKSITKKIHGQYIKPTKYIIQTTIFRPFFLNDNLNQSRVTIQKSRRYKLTAKFQL